MKIRVVFVLVMLFWTLSGCADRAVSGPEDVLVVCNGNSPVSTRIADYYMSKRHIASKFRVVIKTADSSLSAGNEFITPDNYLKQIHQPIREYLKDHKLSDQIRYIVLTKGIPFRLSTDPMGGKTGGPSVDSTLAAMDSIKPTLLTLGDKGTPIINKYWRSKEPFAHARFGGYLVTRLDGYTEADAKALVDRALAPAPSKPVVMLDINPAKGKGNAKEQPKGFFDAPGGKIDTPEIKYSDFNDDMLNLSEMLKDRTDVEVILEDTEAFVAPEKPVTIYASWGSNDGAFKIGTYHSIRFTSRSLAETAVSSSGRTLLPTSGGQSLVADLIAQGAAGAKGYVCEPFLFSMASPTVFVDFYLSGRNLAESFYAASRVIAWKDIVLGDPLCKLK